MPLDLRAPRPRLAAASAGSERLGRDMFLSLLHLGADAQGCGGRLAISHELVLSRENTVPGASCNHKTGFAAGMAAKPSNSNSLHGGLPRRGSKEP